MCTRRCSELLEGLASAFLGEHLPRADFGAAAQLSEAPGADHTAPELLQILRRAAEHAGVLTLDQDDAVVLDGNIEVVALPDSEGLPHLGRDHHPAQIVDFPGHARLSGPLTLPSTPPSPPCPP